MAKYIEKRKWEIQKTLMFIHLVLQPIIGGIIINWRNWITLQPSKVCNVCVDMFGMMILVALFFIAVRDRKDLTMRTAYFVYLISMNSVALFMDLLGWCLDGMPKYRIIAMIVHEIFGLTGAGIIMVFWRYLVEVFNSEDERLELMTKILAAGAGITVITIFGNAFGHYYFYITADGVYTIGEYYVESLLYLVIMAICYILLITRMDVSRNKKMSLLSFITGPITAVFIQTIIHGTSLLYVGTVIALITIYGNVFAETNRELIQEKLHCVEREKEILMEKREHARLTTELSVASNIQTHMIPASFPPFPQYNKDFELFASMTPAKEVGGDFYDFYLIDEDHIALIIADVSGKGIPAALYSMVAKTILKNVAMQGQSPKDIMQAVNRQLCDGPEDIEMFVTAWVGIVEISTGKVVAANAGHEYPVICSENGVFELMKDKHGLVLGGMPGMRYREYEFTIEPGGTLFVYTDGVPEATDSENRLFGMENMVRALNKNPHAHPKDLLANVREEIEAFVEDAEQFDDITMLAFMRKQSEE